MSSRLLAKYAAPLPAAVQKAVGADTAKLTFDSLLTYPCPDLAGDYVEPTGCDFGPHQLDPVIDLEHRRHPLVKGQAVAWARESFEKPDAPYSVRMVEFDFGEEGKPNIQAVPVGTEYYKASDPLSMQVFALRAQDILPAASLEFEMVSGFYKSIGYSELEKRQAYRFEKCRVHRWTVCERGVNPGALTLTKSLTQVPDALAKILTDKRIQVADRWEPLHERIYKALAPAEPMQRTVVRVEKGMPETDPALTTTDQAAATEAMPGDNTPASNGVTGVYEAAQNVIDVCERLRAALANTDSADLYKDAIKHCDMLEAAAEKIKATGDKHDAKLQALKNGKESEESEGDSDTADISTDDDGMLKAIRPVYRKAIKRFKLADLAPAPPPEPEPEEMSPELKKAFADFQKWKKHAS